jgi:hypothetical protein
MCYSSKSSSEEESSFDPMESKMREFQYQKLQKELKQTDEKEKKKLKKFNSSDRDLSQSDISDDDAEKANNLWMSTKKSANFMFIPHKEQGEDENQQVICLSINSKI